MACSKFNTKFQTMKLDWSNEGSSTDPKTNSKTANSELFISDFFLIFISSYSEFVVLDLENCVQWLEFGIRFGSGQFRIRSYGRYKHEEILETSTYKWEQYLYLLIIDILRSYRTYKRGHKKILKISTYNRNSTHICYWKIFRDRTVRIFENQVQISKQYL